MAMTLRLTDEETAALRRRAEREGRSMQSVARAAIVEYVERKEHRERVVASSAAGAKYFDEALQRLGEA
ncbi:MAG: ribbon-helix-helix protein, CopG family [Pseudonocardia sp.]